MRTFGPLNDALSEDEVEMEFLCHQVLRNAPKQMGAVLLWGGQQNKQRLTLFLIIKETKDGCRHRLRERASYSRIVLSDVDPG